MKVKNFLIDIKFQELNFKCVTFDTPRFPNRSFHTSNVYNNKMYIFGGAKGVNTDTDELLTLNTS